MPVVPRRWWLPRDGGGHLLVQAADQPVPKGWRSLPVLFVRSVMERALTSNPTLVYQLHEAAGGTSRSGLSRSARAEHHREIVRNLADVFRAGSLVAYGRAPPVVHHIDAEPGPPPAPFPEDPIEEEKETYINIRLVGEDGEGVPGVRYRVVLPDGAAREGHLDGTGSATLRGKFSGNCQVSFPGLDAQAWEPA